MKSLVSKHNDIQKHISLRAIRGHVDKDILSCEDRSEDIDLAISQLRDGGYGITVPELMECSIDDLKAASFRLWSEEEENGQVLMLIPVLLIPFLPVDMSVYQVASDMTSNETKNCVYKLGEVDTTEIDGCIAYGLWIQSAIHADKILPYPVPDTWTKDILIVHLTSKIKELKAAGNINKDPKRTPNLFALRREMKSILEYIKSDNEVDLKLLVDRYLKLLGVENEIDILKQTFDLAQTRLSRICQKYLKEEHGINIENLVVTKEIGHGIYNGEPITINVRMYGGVTYNEIYMAFYSDDITGLHMPVRMPVYETEEIRTAYFNHNIAYDNLKYREAAQRLEDKQHDDDFDVEAEAEAFADFEHYMTNEQDDDEDRGQSL